jgi:acetyltransferase-like isoleucine patch superfamily enzyme
MTREILVPRLNPNDDQVLVVEIAVNVGDHVEFGQELFVAETSKATIPVQTEIVGYIGAIFVARGDMIDVGSRFCLIADTRDEIAVAPLAGSKLDASGPDQGIDKTLTAKERLRARKTVRSPSQLGCVPHNVNAKNLEIKIVPSHELKWVKQARQLVQSSRRRGEPEVGDDWVAVTSDNIESVQARHGFTVASNVVVGTGSTIKCRSLYLGRGVVIGAGCTIEADSIYIGSATKIGRGTEIVTTELILDEGVHIAAKVVVDLAGGRSEESRLLVGSASLVGAGVLINTCREVVLEVESAVSPGTMLFTHGFWQNVLEGYSASFAPIRVCQKGWIGAGCQVLPGTVIGPGSIVMSNSTVVDNVPGESLVGGVPAILIRKQVRRDMNRKDQVKLLGLILQEFTQHLKFKSCQARWVVDKFRIEVTVPDGQLRLIVLDTGSPSLDPSLDDIVLTFDADAVRPRSPSFNLTRMEYSGEECPLVHELRNFLRRRGMRFRPYDWDSDFSKGL